MVRSTLQFSLIQSNGSGSFWLPCSFSTVADNDVLCSSVWVRGVTTFLLNALRLNCTGNPADPNLEHRCRNKPIPFLSTDIGGQYIQTRARLEIGSDELFTNIERLGTRDQLFYGQLSYDTILASIQSSNAAPLPVNVSGRLERIWRSPSSYSSRVYSIGCSPAMVWTWLHRCRFSSSSTCAG